ncbi:hypothetical protein D3C83_99120 [compost metagenome]
MAGFRGVAGKCEPDAVEDRAFAEVHHLGRNGGSLGAGDEAGEVFGKRGFDGHG